MSEQIKCVCGNNTFTAKEKCDLYRRGSMELIVLICTKCKEEIEYSTE